MSSEIDDLEAYAIPEVHRSRPQARSGNLRPRRIAEGGRTMSDDLTEEAIAEAAKFLEEHRIKPRADGTYTVGERPLSRVEHAIATRERIDRERRIMQRVRNNEAIASMRGRK
jgi:hypothetical protein